MKTVDQTIDIHQTSTIGIKRPTQPLYPPYPLRALRQEANAVLFAIGLDDPAARTVNRSEELRLMAWDEDTQSLGGSRGELPISAG